MSSRSETFGCVLKRAIYSIAAYEGKTASRVEAELGAQRYKAGHLTPEPRTVQILAATATHRGFLSQA